METKKIKIRFPFLILFFLFLFSFVIGEDNTSGESADSLYQKGLTLIEQEKYSEAITVLEESAKQKANFAQAYYYIGLCYSKIGEIEKAKQNLIIAKHLSSDENLKQKISTLLENLGKQGKELPKISEEKQVTKTSTQTNEKNIEEVEIIRKKKAEEQLLLLGIKGNKSETGFLIEEVLPNSIAEKSGLKVKDVIMKIDKDVTANPETVLRKLQTKNICCLFISREGKTERIGWPYLDESQLAETETQKINSFISLGDENYEKKNYLDSIKNYEQSLLVSRNYSKRDEILCKQVKAYKNYIEEFVDKIIQDFKNVPKTASLPEWLTFQKDIQKKLKFFQQVEEKIIDDLYYAEIELFRTGMGKKEEKLNVISSLRQSTEIDLKSIKTKLYDCIKNINDIVDKLDFSKWLKLTKANAYWDGSPSIRNFLGTFSVPQTRGQIRFSTIFQNIEYGTPPSSYTPKISLSFMNTEKYNFEGKVSGELIKPDGKNSGRSALGSISVGPNDRQEFTFSLGNVPTDEIFNVSLVSEGVGRIPPKYSVSLLNWRIKIYVNDILYGEYPIYER